MALDAKNTESTNQASSEGAPKMARSYIGLVVSDKNNKTIVVNISTKKQHPLYKKFIRRDTKLHCHDENNEAHLGDKVEVREISRKLSKLKRYELIQVIERAK
jgi:small subunit ribosomal protein S17